MANTKVPPRRLARPRLLTAATLLPLVVACGTRARVVVSPAPATAPITDAGTPELSLDDGRMFADLEYLASDDLAGRYTLSDDLRRSADYIAEQYRNAGVASVGPDYTAPFPLTTGARIQGKPSLTVYRGRAKPVATDAFTPVAAGGSGTARGPLVFVGYAAQAKAVDPDAEEPNDQGRPGYDDLEGIDLKGKVALVLLDSPGRPDVQELFRRLQREETGFDDAAKPLRRAKNVAGMRQLHRKTRKRIATLIEPFLGGREIPKQMLELPDDPLEAELGLQELLAPVMRMAAEDKGPQFGYREGSPHVKLERLAKAGAVAAIMVRGPRSFVDDEERNEDALADPERAGLQTGGPVEIPAVQLRWKQADKLFRIGGRRLSQLQKAIDTNLMPASRSIDHVEAEVVVELAPIQQRVPNVLATIPGTDLASEIVVFGAHYDHLGTAETGRCGKIEGPDGTDSICNGADDNASGTAMLVELARAYVESGRRPRRTLVFAHFAGEELGLFGSKALADHPPSVAPFTGGELVAMVNLDMVGRLGPRGLAIGGISSSSGWMPLLDGAGTEGLEVLYERSIASRSDHANFYRNKVPVLFFFTHIHKDYHRAGDHADKINRAGMTKIGKIVGRVLVALADGHDVPYTEPKTEADGLSGGLPGSNPASVEKRVKP